MRSPKRLQNLSVPTYTPEKLQSPPSLTYQNQIDSQPCKYSSRHPKPLPATFLTPLQCYLSLFQPCSFLSNQSICLAFIIHLAILYSVPFNKLLPLPAHFLPFFLSSTMTQLLKDLAWNYLIRRKAFSDQTCIGHSYCCTIYFLCLCYFSDHQVEPSRTRLIIVFPCGLIQCSAHNICSINICELK